MTEEQATKKWCPFARATPPNSSAAVNRYGDRLPDATLCIGSRCMAWRVTYDAGYCGLVGSPGHAARARGAPSWQRDAAGDAGAR
jgi:hypothetical protein